MTQQGQIINVTMEVMERSMTATYSVLLPKGNYKYLGITGGETSIAHTYRFEDGGVLYLSNEWSFCPVLSDKDYITGQNSLRWFGAYNIDYFRDTCGFIPGFGYYRDWQSFDVCIGYYNVPIESKKVFDEAIRSLHVTQLRHDGDERPEDKWEYGVFTPNSFQ